MRLNEVMPIFGKFHCNRTIGMDGSAIYEGKTYPIVLYERYDGGGNVRINVGEVYLFSTIEELKQYGNIEI